MFFCTIMPAEPARKLTINGRDLNPQQWRVVENIERFYSVRLPDGGYWYDNRTGAVGFWNGPAFGLVQAGLNLGGPMPANCSGGLSRVFVNGRALHPLDIAALSQLTPVNPGRYWMDAQGNVGYEGGPAVVNLVQIANARGSARGGQRRVYSNSELGVILNDGGACTSAGCLYH